MFYFVCAGSNDSNRIQRSTRNVRDEHDIDIEAQFIYTWKQGLTWGLNIKKNTKLVINIRILLYHFTVQLLCLVFTFRNMKVKIKMSYLPCVARNSLVLAVPGTKGDQLSGICIHSSHAHTIHLWRCSYIDVHALPQQIWDGTAGIVLKHFKIWLITFLRNWNRVH